jgi:hypothetical protein
MRSRFACFRVGLDGRRAGTVCCVVAHNPEQVGPWVASSAQSLLTRCAPLVTYVGSLYARRCSAGHPNRKLVRASTRCSSDAPKERSPLLSHLGARRESENRNVVYCPGRCVSREPGYPQSFFDTGVPAVCQGFLLEIYVIDS